MRMLAYGLAADVMDDYMRIGETTTIESLKKFVKAVIGVFGDEYLRSPNNVDVARLLAERESRGFPGMLRSIDRMHWKWKNCLITWKGSYNDINVWERSHLFANLVEGHALAANYSINGHNYTTRYYLADGIYPPWSTFVKTILHPQENKHKNFATAQELIWKDVERAFGVLQSHFAIVYGPFRFWDPTTFKDIMIVCVIMHNMIIEDEHGVYMHNNNYEVFEENVDLLHELTMDFVQFLQNHQHIRNREAHSQLQADLIEHL
ncbi:hypothetical protein L1049_024901 [Liquidambar formosana]|uniref:Nuclease HARBI1 n=1 Tax=Liquidambar formosana TaxID=63359 RepID=A0AAP0RVY7_LIQFO